LKKKGNEKKKEKGKKGEAHRNPKIREKRRYDGGAKEEVKGGIRKGKVLLIQKNYPGKAKKPREKRNLVRKKESRVLEQAEKETQKKERGLKKAICSQENQRMDQKKDFWGGEAARETEDED